MKKKRIERNTNPFLDRRKTYPDVNKKNNILQLGDAAW